MSSCASCASCPTYSRASRALRSLVFQVPRVLRALVLHVPRAIRALVLVVFRALPALMPYEPRVLRALVPHASYVLFYFTVFVTCVLAQCSCPTSSCGPHPSLASDVSSLILILILCLIFSCLSPLALLMFELHEFLKAWAKVKSCDMPFLKKKRWYNGFSYK